MSRSRSASVPNFFAVFVGADERRRREKLGRVRRRSIYYAAVTTAERIDLRLTLPNFSLLRLSSAPTNAAKNLGTLADRLLDIFLQIFADFLGFFVEEAPVSS
jgi:hypothetical protein